MGDDTIFALASGAGRSGIGVIRVSGQRARAVLRAVLMEQPVPPPRRAALRRLYDGAGQVVDRGLVLWFPAPNSYTGEDVFELQVHGGRAVIDGLLSALGRISGTRLAGPGEFSRRAFMNGRLDLTQVEAVADLVAAETEAQRRQALRQLDGELGAVYERWRGELIGLLAGTEAAIDFVDEDIPPDLEDLSTELVGRLLGEINGHLADGHRGERLRDGVSIAIVGPPNAGKSSLLNVLARRDVAIVSDVAGTTRDVIEVYLDLNGYPAVVADTAGLRSAVDGVEAEGVRRARARAENADLRLVVADSSQPGSLRAVEDQAGPDSVVVWNKCDLVDVPVPGGLAVSSLTGAGVDELIGTLAGMVAEKAGTGETAGLTRARHREALQACADSLQEALSVGELEVRAECLRMATRMLGRITGRVDVEDVLDALFAEFCIGK